MDRELDIMYTSELTKREKEVLEYIKEEYLRTSGYTPSYRKIMRAVNLSSTLQVFQVMEKLETKGLIKKITEMRGDNKVTVRYMLVHSDNEILDIINKAKQNEDRLKSLNTAKIPLIGKLENKEDFFAPENIKEYIGVPEEYGKQENMFAFQSMNSNLAEVGIFRHSIVIVDKIQRYIAGDYVAIYDNTRINIQKYKRYRTKEDILGKVIGSYTRVTF